MRPGFREIKEIERLCDSKKSERSRRRSRRQRRNTGAHILAEIGEVLAACAEGRSSDDEITIYKSLGHIVQDLASAWWLYQQPDPRP